MYVKRNEYYYLNIDNLFLEESGDFDVKVKVEEDSSIKGFTLIFNFNWMEAKHKLQEVLKKENKGIFCFSNIYRVRNDLDLNSRNEYDEEEEWVSIYVDNKLLDKIECMNLEEIIYKYWNVWESRPTVKSIDDSYIVLACDDWDNDLVLYIDARMVYANLETEYYLVHEDN